MKRRYFKLQAKPKENKPNPFFKLDIPLLLAVVTLLTVGLVMVYDVSSLHAYRDFGDKYYYIKQQLIWAFLGTSFLIFFSFFDYHFLKKFALPFFVASFLLLLAVFVPGLGVESGGAHRWLRLGPVTIQPAEIIKISSIIFLASIFSTGIKTKPFLIIVGGVTAILGFFQRDLGSSIVYFLTACALYIVAGARLLWLVLLSPLALGGFLYFILSSSYRRQRILAFLDPFSDPEGFTYHISQVLIALGSGGWFGLGLGQSRQKFEYIPEVTTDSIFAVVGEEFGFIGATLLILLLSFLVYRGFKIAEQTEDKFGKLLAFGLTFWLGIQAAINLAAMVSLIPLTGVPLPFISYGGSALLANLVAVGILLNISKSTKKD